jgi:hypothetical protein
MPFHDDLPSNGQDDAAEREAALDEEFPLGDGLADTEATVICPYCSEAVTIALDAGGGPAQEYVEDCEVCCQPWQVSVIFHGGEATVSLRSLDE